MCSSQNYFSIDRNPQISHNTQTLEFLYEKVDPPAPGQRAAVQHLEAASLGGWAGRAPECAQAPRPPSAHSSLHSAGPEPFRGV